MEGEGGVVVEEDPPGPGGPDGRGGEGPEGLRGGDGRPGPDRGRHLRQELGPGGLVEGPAEGAGPEDLEGDGGDL